MKQVPRICAFIEIAPLLSTSVALAQSNYGKATALLDSEPSCPGDGNEDKVVNGQNIKSWRFFNQLGDGQSSWSDFNLDGLTDNKDLTIIHEHFGTKCLPKK